MTPEEHIALLQSIARLYRHVMEGQQKLVKLKARVKTLEDSSELRDLLDSEPKAEGAYSFPESWEGPSPFLHPQDQDHARLTLGIQTPKPAPIMKTPLSHRYHFTKAKRLNPDIHVTDSKGQLVCIVPRLCDQKRQEEGAAQIVKSCNHHDKLVMTVAELLKHGSFAINGELANRAATKAAFLLSELSPS